MKYKVYITASDKVLWALEHTSKAFNKYCPGLDVVVLDIQSQILNYQKILNLYLWE